MCENLFVAICYHAHTHNRRSLKGRCARRKIKTFVLIRQLVSKLGPLNEVSIVTFQLQLEEERVRRKVWVKLTNVHLP